MQKICLLAGLCATLLFTACKPNTPPPEAPATYTITSAVSMDTFYTKEFVAKINSVKDIEVRAQERGFLQKIFVDEGQHVGAGQMMFKIMPQLYQADVAKAQSETQAAEIELQNARTLAEKNVISVNEQKLAQAKLEGARAEASMARTHLSFTDVRAPFAGIIDRIPKKLGSLIDEGELLTTLSDNSQMYAYFNVSEPEYLNYQTNVANRGDNSVHLLMANGQALPQSGIVETIEGEFDSETGNIAFRAKFPNEAGLLRNGETGKVLMTMPLKNVLVIPQKATYEIQDKKFVYVVGKDGIVHATEIKISADLPDLYVVSGGITAQDNILLDGVQKVKDGDKIMFKHLDGRQVIGQLKLHAE